MSDYDDDQDDNEQDNEPSQQNSREDPNIKQLRQKAKKADALEAELTVLRRERAFDKANLPDDVPGISFFRENYKGDLSPEAIKEAAVTHGFLSPQVPDTSADERAAQDRLALAAAGVSNPTPPDLASQLDAVARANPGREQEAIANHMRSLGRSL